MKLLAVTPRFPYPLDRGDRLRAFHHLRVLAPRHDVVLVALSEGPVPSDQLEIVQDLGVKVHVVQRSRATTVKGVASAALQGVPLNVGYFHSAGVESEVRRIIEAESPEHVTCYFIRTGWVADGLGIPSTIDYQDALAMAMRRRAAQQPVGVRSAFEFEAGRIGRYEARVFDSFDSHMVISEQDRLVLEVPDREAVEVVHNGVETEFFVPTDEPADALDVGLMGNMGYPPNVRAARFLAEEVMPLVRRERPGSRLLLAGSRPATTVRRLAGDDVEVTGWLDDIRTGYRRSRVMAAPLFMGAGQQNKILEAMSSGVPCVTTELVNNAIGAEDGTEVMLASTPEEFSRSILELLESPQRYSSMAERGRELVLERYSWDSVGDRLSQLASATVEAAKGGTGSKGRGGGTRE